MTPSQADPTPLRILLVLPSLNPADGGPPESVRTLSAAFARDGHTCEIATLDHPEAPWLADLPCPVTALGPGILGKYRYSKKFKSWMTDHVRRFDIVVVNGIYQYHSFASRLVCRRANVPYVVFTHGALDPWFRRRYPLKQIKKWLYWPWADYRVLRDAQRVLFTTADERDLAPQSFWLYRVNPAVVGYGTAEPPLEQSGDADDLLAAFPGIRDKKILLFLSRIDRKKGCELLIDAYAQIASTDPSLLLLMAGPDSSGWRAELEAQAQALGIAERILWTGPLAGSRKWAAFRRAEAFVLTSHSENFGIVVVEALACGTPVLISQRVNIWHEVVDAGAGYATADTPAGALALLNQWLATSDDDRQRMRIAARSAFVRHFEIGAVARTIARTLSLCVAEHRRLGD